ncbi:MAG TPA: replicative DNA helicase, partial [Spongiibacteraceae bacterium]|nr:replicative DNA helicase [Spongiibacteraceae bacterium]
MSYPDEELAQLRIPPNSTEAEQSVLGGLMIANDAWDSIAELIEEKDFYRPEHRLIFKRMAQLIDAEQPIDIVTLSGAMESADEIERAGGFAYLAEIANATPSAANVRAYASVVRNRARARSLIAIGQNIAELGWDESQPIDEREELAQAALMQLGDAMPDENDIHVSSELKSYVEELDRRANCDGIAGLASGFVEIDRRTNGFMPGDLIIIAGRPGSGKTTLAMNIAEHAGIFEKKNVLVFSMEMPRRQLFDRMMSSVGKIPYALLRNGRALGHPEFDNKLMPAAKMIKESKIFIDDRGSLTVSQVRMRARKIHKKHPLSAIFIDYIQLMRAKAESRVMEITKISQDLKALAKELEIPIFALSQLSRKCEEQRREPIASDLRDSGSIEQDADSIFLIYRPELYDEDSPHKGHAKIICPKLRNGEPGDTWLDSNLSRCRFD